MITKPMLSATLKDEAKLKFPVLASPKLDGIRCLVIEGKCVSRTFKPIPNTFIRTWIETNLISGLDGEIITLNPDGSIRTFNEIQGDVMRESGEPNFRFEVFDFVWGSCDKAFKNRYQDLVKFMEHNTSKEIGLVEHVQLNTISELNDYEETCLKLGYEGVMVRSMTGPYKNGRATEREGFLSKVKRFEDSEAVIVGFVEQQENTNEAEEDAFGRTKRSSHQDGMVGKNTLGKFIVKEIGNTPWKDKEFSIGTGEGLTEVLRQEIWDSKESHLGRIVTYKYQPHGVKDLPRLPIWKGFRSKLDL